MTARSTCLILLAASVFAAMLLPAAAQEACVRCDNPFAIYRCQVSDPSLPANASIALICITELAKRNAHATCAVSRATESVCSGELVVVAPAPDAPIPQAHPAGIVAASPAAEPAKSGAFGADPDELPRTDEGRQADASPPATNAPPETVEELAKQTAIASQKGLNQAGGAVVDAAKTTGQSIEKAGDAIGSAAKKTWRCISSLFGNC
ncbi:MAG: hypothetical protein APF80_15680 [Alphaproteobacteria bacterium BRH_c36]|nr:MAG: hypothetical protein APF80_15680 [Alphaproteobacteria bacterium BRH_c36]